MTIQIGIVGTDGILIASDTHWFDEHSVRESWNETKIKIHTDCGIAVARAGKLVTAGYLANEIIDATVRNENWLDVDFGVKQTIEEKVLSLAEKGSEHCQCLVAFTRPHVKLFCFQIVKVGESWRLVIDEISSKKCTGDYRNSAIFWAERYCPRGPYKVPIRKLVTFASHLVYTAHVLNTAGISGLEIVLCEANGIHRVPDEEISQLELQAEERDKSIGCLLGIA